MKQFYLIFFLLIFSSCIVLVDNNSKNRSSKNTTVKSSEQINKLLDQWHKDVANSDFDAYFNKMSQNAVFIGTDASENWTVQQFKDFAKPHFDKKKTWDFKPYDRNVFFNKNGDIAWFDEVLDTWMGVCRGSGVLSKKNNSWRIEHYVLSIVIPNEDVTKIVDIKKEKDSQIIKSLKNNKY